MKQSAIKLAIFEKLAELDCFEDVDTALAHLTQQIDYYVD